MQEYVLHAFPFQRGSVLHEIRPTHRGGLHKRAVDLVVALALRRSVPWVKTDEARHVKAIRHKHSPDEVPITLGHAAQLDR